MAGLGTRDLEGVVAFLAEARPFDGPGPFTTELVDRLAELMRCEFARYMELDVVRRVEIAYIPCSAEVETFGIENGEMTEADWDDHLTNPCYRASRSEPGGVFVQSELVEHRPPSQEDASYWDQELRGSGLADRMAVRVEAPTWADMVFDSADRHFGARDIELGTILRPHLAASWRGAAVRRRLQAALEALEHDGGDGVVFLSSSGAIEFASTSARYLLGRYFEGSSVRLPGEVADWHAAARGMPLIVNGGGQNLVIESTDDGSAILLRERAKGDELLTTREREVMRCVAGGLSNAEIAGRLWIEVTTVRKHLEHVYAKLGVGSRTAAVAKLRLTPMEMVS